MPPKLVTSAELKLLEPYLLGESPRDNGEWDMYCPLHEDTNRSASLNIYQAIWNCQASCGGGHVRQLFEAREAGKWVLPGTGSTNGHRNGSAQRSKSLELPSEGKVAGWSAALLDNTDGALSLFKVRRGIYEATLKEYQIGYDMVSKVYTIPVRDRLGNLVGLRKYKLDPGTRRKIWGIAGHNAPRLYPIGVLKAFDVSGPLVICEGEWDALATIQAGYAAITRTASATTWSPKWAGSFRKRDVFLCHDADEAGQRANDKVGRALAKVARSVRVLSLPYGITEKHGKDLSDFWMEFGQDEFEEMLAKAVEFGDPRLSAETLPSDARVIDALDSRRARTPLRLTVTVEAKAQPGYTVPRKAELSCAMDAGAACEYCPLRDAGGSAIWQAENDDTILSMMDITSDQLKEFIRKSYGARCKKLDIEHKEEQAVETLFVRPSVDHNSTEGADYTSIRVRHIGGHDTPENETVQLLGALYPSPKSQVNEFVAWEANPIETSIDRFELDEETIEVLKKFRPNKGHSPLKKLRFIARELEANVTKIYGRTEMHMAMDLTWHSGLAFEFDGQMMDRGWLELLVAGDTRTGKSEAARLLARHFGAGEVVSCETASLPGILGAVQQLSGQQWAITWGKIPLNDRRCVVLDEVDGLHPHEIASLSHLRSSGIAEINKVKHGRTHARTRLIWLGNPRKGNMADLTFGIEALVPLIGKPEDIARFDLVMTVASDEVSSEIMNRPHQNKPNPKYTSDACKLLLKWAWSRKADQIRWDPAAEALVFVKAKEMGARYVDNPPLVQAASVRIKIARVAVAMAMRTFSTDMNYETCVVRAEHVTSAVEFMDSLYTMPGFGYQQRSENMQRKHDHAMEHYDQALETLRDDMPLAYFLRDRASFQRFDVESFLGMNIESANHRISKLFAMGMLTGGDGHMMPTPELREILRGIK